MTNLQVAILQAAVLGAALAEVAQLEDPHCETDPVDCTIQAGHEALLQLQDNPEALKELDETAAQVFAVYAVESSGALGPLAQELMA